MSVRRSAEDAGAELWAASAVTAEFDGTVAALQRIAGVEAAADETASEADDEQRHKDMAELSPSHAAPAAALAGAMPGMQTCGYENWCAGR